MTRRSPRSAPAIQASALRARLYSRVSSEEQVDGYSLDAQARAAAGFCESRSWLLEREYREEGKSAWTDDANTRPAFSAMLADAEAGRFDVLVVHRLDRLARNVRVTLEVLQRLDAAGVGFVSLNENMDFTTPIGRVVLTTLAAFAEYYSANLSAETRKGKAERKAQGLYNGLLPFGTVKGEDGLPVADPTNHAGLVTMFELAAAGRTDREIAQALTAAGYRTTGNRGANPFTKDTVREIVQNRFYLGELPDGQGGWMPGKHAGVVDPAVFAAAQTARQRNAKRPRRVQTAARSPWALSGLATCTCGAAMKASGRSNGRRRIECAGRVQGSGCTAATFYADVVEAQIGDLLTGFAVPEEQREPLVRAWRMARERDIDAEVDRGRLERKLARLKELYLEGDLDKGTYQARRAEVLDQLASLPTAEDQAGDAVGRKLAEYLGDVSRAWAEATPEERNRLARQLLSGVVIENRTAVAVKPRPDLLPLFKHVARCQAPGDRNASAEATGVARAVPTDPRRRHRPGIGSDRFPALHRTATDQAVS